MVTIERIPGFFARLPREPASKIPKNNEGWGTMRVSRVLLLALCLSACATITRGTTQIVLIDTPGVPAAQCEVLTSVGAQQVTTPGNVVLAKGPGSLPVRCNKECYQEGASIISSSIEAMTAGNLIVGGVVGIGVDAMSGAMNKYPDQVLVTMVPIPGCGAPPPASRRPRAKRLQ